MNHPISDFFKAYLFAKHLFVSDSGLESSEAAEALFSLSRLFNIRIIEGETMADVSMIRLASSELGIDVPHPFYRDFPRSTRNLSPDDAEFDRIMHYIRSRLLGIYAPELHPDLEERFARLAFREDTETKDFSIITADDACALLVQTADDLLLSSRPLSSVQYEFVLHSIRDLQFVPRHCRCKNTAYRLLLDTDDMSFSEFLTLPDVLKFAEYLCYRQYKIEDSRKLKLPRRYRKLIIRVLDHKMSISEPDIASCCERKKIWCGLLHNIHYQPDSDSGRRFVKAMREGANISVYSRFEAALKKRDIKAAVDILMKGKGPGEVLRHAAYLLSRCNNLEEMYYVIDQMGSGNILLQMQLLMQFDHYIESRDNVRYFRFMRNGRLFIHRENLYERARRRSWLPEGFIDDLPFIIRRNLERTCQGTLGSVYVDPDIVHIALPLQEAGSYGGYGVLPKGSLFHLNPRKVIRVFVYWKEALSVTLNARILTKDYLPCNEKSYGGYYINPYKKFYSHHIRFSGYQASGYNGGAEYMDIDLQGLESQCRDLAYVIFEANVYNDNLTNTTPERDVKDNWFDNFDCHAGFMQRDRITSGEVFEPSTVETSFRVTGDSPHSYLFGIDIKRKTLVWLNLVVESKKEGTIYSHNFLSPFMSAQYTLNMFDFFSILAEKLTDNPMDADVIVSDKILPHKPDASVIHSYDTEKILALMNTREKPPAQHS